MSYYEHVFIVRQDVSAQQVEALTETFSGVITELGGTVEKTESWGLKSLAYRIKKNRKGHYVLLNLDAPSDAIKEMERQMRFHEDILRYITIKVDELDPNPSIQMQGRSRDDRPARDEDRTPVAAPVAAVTADAEKPAAEAAVEPEAADTDKAEPKEEVES
ncbi:MAG: 30S ribosomal protein S6 [Proteobacteria bacterium]|nr:30S ribosomal protein S6 [Pseudomonadota bacterium]